MRLLMYFQRLRAPLGSLVGSLALVCIPYLSAGTANASATTVYATVREWTIQPALVHVPANTAVTLVFEDEGQRRRALRLLS